MERSGSTANKNTHTGLKIYISLLTIAVIILSYIVIKNYIPQNNSPQIDNISKKDDNNTYNKKSNELDPYELASIENNIFGKDIVPILSDLKEGEDYTIRITDYFNFFDFDDIDFPYGESPKLTLYTDVGQSLVTIVSYSFEVDASIFSGRYTIRKVCDLLSEYYGVEPVCSYASDYGYITTTIEEIDKLLYQGNKTLFIVEFNADPIGANLYIHTGYDNKTTCNILYSPY